MKRAEHVFWWIALVAGAVLFAEAMPRAFPLLPQAPTTLSDQAQTVAVEFFKRDGRIDPQAASNWRRRLDVDRALERRLLLEGAWDDPATRPLRQATVSWAVFDEGRKERFGPPIPSRSPLFARVDFHGRILGFRADLEADGDAPSAAEASARARRDLALYGLDEAAVNEPEIRRSEEEGTSELELAFPFSDLPLPETFSAAAEVLYSGDRLSRVELTWFDEELNKLNSAFNQRTYLTLPRWAATGFLFLYVAVFYLRRYDAAEVRILRARQMATIVAVAGSGWYLILLLRLLEDRAGLAPMLFGGLVWLGVVAVSAAFAFLTWGFGESRAREIWSDKLAAFEALLRGRWRNATVARASLRGAAGGMLAAAFAVWACVALQRFDVWLSCVELLGAGLALLRVEAYRPLSGIHVLTTFFLNGLVPLLAGLCVLGPPLIQNRGKKLGGLLLVGALALLIKIPFLPDSFWAALLLLLGFAAVPAFFFLRWDLLSAVFAAQTLFLLPRLYPMLAVPDFEIRVGAWVGLLIAYAPLLVSWPSLRSGREVDYEYDPETEIPADVLRSVNEQARKSFELETARRIQSSILPDLPPRIDDFDVAATYRPSSEVGGDFYDVVRLQDGRIVAALGDVAGHGVSSGLIMAMMRAALRVQIRYDDDPATVCRTLNAVVREAAADGPRRTRFLTTLCYLVVDPARRKIDYVCAGHAFYRTTADGGTRLLASGDYPLGVRDDLDPVVRSEPFEPGDLLFLGSDGLTEAGAAENAEELFGFERLEAAILRGRGDAEKTRVAVLEDLAEFSGPREQADDQSILVLGWSQEAGADDNERRNTK